MSTDRLARACATHPKRTLAIWLGVVFVSFVVIALLLGDALTSEGDVSEAQARIGADAGQHLSVVRQEPPAMINIFGI